MTIKRDVFEYIDAIQRELDNGPVSAGWVGTQLNELADLVNDLPDKPFDRTEWDVRPSFPGPAVWHVQCPAVQTMSLPQLTAEVRGYTDNPFKFTCQDCGQTVYIPAEMTTDNA